MEIGENMDSQNKQTKTYQTIFGKVDYDLIKEGNIERLKEDKSIIQAVELLRQGEIVAFPTETVYGLGADACNKTAVEKIYIAKGRPQDNPLIVHIADKKQLYSFIKGELSLAGEKLISAFWPGPLTIIVEKNTLIPDRTTAGLDSIAIRIPSHPLTLALLELADLALAAPSANKSGAPSPTKACHVLSDLNAKIPMILDGGAAKVGLESTIVDVRGKPKILRPGGISREEIEDVLSCKLGASSQESSLANDLQIDKPLAPGMKYRHYSPETPLYILKGKKELELILNELVENDSKRKPGFIISDESFDKYGLDMRQEGIKVMKMGSREEPEMIAAKLFAILRSLDQFSLPAIYVEAIPKKGIGEAVMNRLLKASSKE